MNEKLYNKLIYNISNIIYSTINENYFKISNIKSDDNIINNNILNDYIKNYFLSNLILSDNKIKDILLENSENGINIELGNTPFIFKNNWNGNIDYKINKLSCISFVLNGNLINSQKKLLIDNKTLLNLPNSINCKNCYSDITFKNIDFSNINISNLPIKNYISCNHTIFSFINCIFHDNDTLYINDNIYTFVFENCEIIGDADIRTININALNNKIDNLGIYYTTYNSDKLDYRINVNIINLDYTILDILPKSSNISDNRSDKLRWKINNSYQYIINAPNTTCDLCGQYNIMNYIYSKNEVIPVYLNVKSLDIYTDNKYAKFKNDNKNFIK